MNQVSTHPACHTPSLQSRPHEAVIAKPTLEYKAIFAGVQAGDAALAHFHLSGALVLFTEAWRSDEAGPKLAALRTYAELRRVLLCQGRDIPATSLIVAGFTSAQIVRFNATIADIPTCAKTNSAPDIRPAQSEIFQ